MKFFVVKAVIFFAFWQSMVLSFGEKLGYVGGTHYCDISAAEIALCWQNFLICNEMFLAAVAMYVRRPLSYRHFIKALSCVCVCVSDPNGWRHSAAPSVTDGGLADAVLPSVSLSLSLVTMTHQYDSSRIGEGRSTTISVSPLSSVN